jgi:two-component system OmpR family response regulator
MAEILIIEDDESTLLLMRRVLEPEHSVTGCLRMSEARQALRKKTFNLILLDVVLPDGDGFMFFDELGKSGQLKSIPVLFVTGKSSVSDQVMGYSLGAEDYIVKPINPLILRACVNSKISKYRRLENDADVFTAGTLKFDLAKQKISIRTESDESELETTSLEFKLLLHFARREEQVFTRDQLMTAIWGDGIHVMDRTIDTHICHLRSKLKGSSYTLEAVHGVGYRLIRLKNEEPRQAA